jgi:alpha/beta superfamily hydrolase
MFKEKLITPGEHAFHFQGKTGKLEAILTVPEVLSENYLAILGHPHSLYGGTMQNKVITTMARAFKDLGLLSVRFNFRGVGISEGTYDEGIGESEDMLLLAQQWLAEMPNTLLIFAGFSFGSYVTYRAAAQLKNVLLISVAPAVHHYNYNEFNPRPHPWVILQGDSDEVVPAHLVWEFAEQQTPPLPMIRFPETSHFFHGKLLDLRTEIQKQFDLL